MCKLEAKYLFFYYLTGIIFYPKNVERFTILRVILAQGPC